MKFEIFIAKRFSLKNKPTGNFSLPMVRIATFGITLGMVVMVVSVAIILGFKKEIQDKVIGFGSPIQLVNYDMNRSYENNPISDSWPFLNDIKSIKGVVSVNRFVTKPGILKKNNEIEALVLKGVDNSYSWNFFKNYIIKGKVPLIEKNKISNNILVSKYFATRLNINVCDKINVYFVQEPMRMRRFKVCGIYKTDLKVYDDLFAFVDLRHLQKLNGWDNDSISGFEIHVNNFESINKINNQVKDIIAMGFNSDGSSLRSITTFEQAPQIYDWLNLQDMNVWVILILITLVAGINMITGVLIMILEKINIIGLFKALGARNKQIGKIFLINASTIIIKGLLIGDSIALLLCYLQKTFGIIHLNPDNYYLHTVPIKISWFYFIILNIGVFAVNLLMMLLPALFITRINPAKSINID